MYPSPNTLAVKGNAYSMAKDTPVFLFCIDNPVFARQHHLFDVFPILVTFPSRV